MINNLPRSQLSMVFVMAAMIIATSVSAINMTKRHRLLDGVVTGTTIAGLGDMMSTINQFQNALFLSEDGGDAPGRVRMLDAIRSRLVALKIGESEALVQSPEEQSARLSLGGEMLDLQLLAIDGDDPDTRVKIGAILRGMQDALQTLDLAATGSLKHSIAEDLTATDAALQLHLTLLATTVVCGILLLILGLRRGWTQHRLARRDSLTGLMNRLNFTETLTRLIAEPGDGNEVGLVLLDIDLFKNINDTLGHAAGDAVLKVIAKRLATLASDVIHIARLGGDEFALIITARQAHRVAGETAKKILEFASEPFDLDRKQFTVGMSVGTAITPLEGCNSETLLKNADIALYAAKAAGRGRSRAFSVRMDRELRERRDLEHDLVRAVSENQIQVHFQPIADLVSGRIVNCEALARWNHPQRGFVPPLKFISVAEDIGLIQKIGESVLCQACEAALEWPDNVRVSVNLSAHQFDDGNLVEMVANTLARFNLPPERLELEITESVLVRDNASVSSTLRDLREIGVQIALDDFGTGFSSLSYLQRFAIDRIKIDQSFVRNMASKSESAAIVESVCLLAKKLGLSTTGEGIETESDASLLRSFGCVEGQGYLFDKPMPLAACTARILAETQTSRAA